MNEQGLLIAESHLNPLNQLIDDLPLEKKRGLMPSECFPEFPREKTTAKTEVVDGGHANAEPDGTTRIGKGEDSADSGWMG